MAQGSRFAAEVFADVDDEGVEFVEQLMIGGEIAFEERAEALVGIFRRSEGVAFKKAASVGVDDENGMAAGVEKDGVGGFGADTVDREELSAENRGWRVKHTREGTCVMLVDKTGERFQLASLLAKVA